MITIDQLKDAIDRTEALRRYLNIDAKLIQVEEEQLRTQVPGFWDDTKKAEAQMRKVKSLQSWLDVGRGLDAFFDGIGEVPEFAGHIVALDGYGDFVEGDFA